jgi:acyl dehydratase
VSALLEWDDVAVGDSLPPLRVRLRRVDLIMYAGASGDFNPIHWSDRVAVTAGLPGVIAHGMLTMAVAGRAVTDWCGDPGALVSFGCRFARAVRVPDDDDGVAVTVTGMVAEKLPDHRVRIELRAAVDAHDGAGSTVLDPASAVVQL